MPLALQADYTLVAGQLLADVIVRVDRFGRIAGVEDTEGASVLPALDGHEELVEAAGATDGMLRIKRLRGKVLLPGFVNGHSHGFQRLLRGHTEARLGGPESDDFWSWREAMYKALDALDPDQVEAVCRLSFLEMLSAGYTHVAEFHYLHHQPGGRPYADRLEMTRRVMAAADWAGIGLTLLRGAYGRAGWNRTLQPAQSRFVDDGVDRWGEDLEATFALEADDDHRPVRVGIAAHSVRALDRGWLEGIARIAGGRPLHIHVAEQQAEVDQCLAEHGMRPVELLDDIGLLEGRLTAVHATHLGPGEADRLGRNRNSVCICPTTERNLGDGLPDLRGLLDGGCTLALGTDSHVRIDPFSEMRGLEDGERLRTQRRNTLAKGSQGAVAPMLFDVASRGTARSVGLDAGVIQRGMRADLVSMDLETPALAGLDEDPHALLSGLVLGGHPSQVTDVWVGGRHVLRDGQCLRWRPAAEEFSRVARQIWS